MGRDMATTGSALKRSLVAAIIMVIVSGCAGSPRAIQPQHAATAGSVTAKPVPEVMKGGSYLFGPFGDMPSVTIVAMGPDGWFGYPSWAMDGPEPVRADAPTGIGISFFTANGVYSDPCHWDVQGTGGADVGDVVVGPTVDDLVAALRANTFYTSSQRTPVTIDGYRRPGAGAPAAGRSVHEMRQGVPGIRSAMRSCSPGRASTPRARPTRWHLYILDVEGTRLIAVILSYAKTPQTDLDLARNIIETLDINP